MRANVVIALCHAAAAAMWAVAGYSYGNKLAAIAAALFGFSSGFYANMALEQSLDKEETK